MQDSDLLGPAPSRKRDELARRGRQVLVLDRDDLPGVATRAAAGMLAPTSEADLADRTLVDLALDSLRRYPGFVAGLEGLTGQSCGYRTEGTLWIALNRGLSVADPARPGA